MTRHYRIDGPAARVQVVPVRVYRRWNLAALQAVFDGVVRTWDARIARAMREARRC